VAALLLPVAKTDEAALEIAGESNLSFSGLPISGNAPLPSGSITAAGTGYGATTSAAASGKFRVGGAGLGGGSVTGTVDTGGGMLAGG
jgi:hypothetical protein